jgi:hypothetical protein
MPGRLLRLSSVVYLRPESSPALGPARLADGFWLTDRDFTGMTMGSGGSGGGVTANVFDQPEHIFGDKPTDRAAGVDADDHLSVRVEDEAGGLQV